MPGFLHLTSPLTTCATKGYSHHENPLYSLDVDTNTSLTQLDVFQQCSTSHDVLFWIFVHLFLFKCRNNFPGLGSIQHSQPPRCGHFHGSGVTSLCHPRHGRDRCSCHGHIGHTSHVGHTGHTARPKPGISA